MPKSSGKMISTSLDLSSKVVSTFVCKQSILVKSSEIHVRATDVLAPTTDLPECEACKMRSPSLNQKTHIRSIRINPYMLRMRMKLYQE